MSEEWRDVCGFEGFYQVSNLGRVRSVPRTIVTSQGKRLPIKGGLLQSFPHGAKHNMAQGKGYLCVSLMRNKSHKRGKIHLLVLNAFVGPKPDGMQGLHVNGDCQDNKQENLRWGTASQNAKDSVVHGSHYQASKTVCPRGHEYDYSHTDSHGVTRRGCTECHREALRRSRAKRKLSKV